MYRVIQSNQTAQLKTFIDMNNKLRTKTKKQFFKLMNNAAFEKTMENVKKNRYFKHVTTVPTTKKLSSVRTKLSYDKMLFRKFISNRNKQNK